MHFKIHPRISQAHLSTANIVVAIAIRLSFFLFLNLAVGGANGQSFTVIHQFAGGVDGATPEAGLTMDAAGNLYGTTYSGGSNNCQQGCGIVFQLSNRQSEWILTPIHTFLGTPQGDGALPASAVLVFGPDGRLYGTTYGGGTVPPRVCLLGCGTVFRLTAPAALGTWIETVLYSFRGGVDGRHPLSDVTFDQTGNLYGTTSFGGIYNGGTVYELSSSSSGWTESVPYSFQRGIGSDGFDPEGGVTFDPSGNLYGTTVQGGGAYGSGTVYQLTPSGGGWRENVLYAFYGIGYPGGDLIFDAEGNLYGVTVLDTVFTLHPVGNNWYFSVIYDQSPGCGTWGQALTMDAMGNLYGATWCGGSGSCTSGCGTVFKLTPVGVNWMYTLLYSFTGGADGARPHTTVLIDPHGNLYGTAEYRGGGTCNGGCGTVWKITP
jgi:uncharacterized repeat protein (TIGR03803 family)